MLNDAEILKLFLPELLIEHFEMMKFEEENKILHIYFEEKNTAPKEFFFSNAAVKKDLYPKLPLMIFPLRGKKRLNFTSNAGDGLM
ncbi:hypothetical protein ACFOEQ_14485 [Chryseobacterium arachidis]|uniref:hypothetical protein n=1 Tax=Chryseobacterium arachidis TaxID=1416778 RepID=UPI00360BB952